MKKTFTGGAVPNSQAIYAKIHDAKFMTEIYTLLGYNINGPQGVLCEVTHVRWAEISVLSWIFFFMFPFEELFLYVPTGYACIIMFYAVFATAALSLTYAAYKFGERVEAGTYRLGRLAKIVDFSAFALIALMAGVGGDLQTSVRSSFGVVGFMWQFHCLMKLGWKFVDYTLFEMFLIDTGCISIFCAASPPWSEDMNYAIVILWLLYFVLLCDMKCHFHATNFDTVEDRHCVMCDLAMERYPEKVVELLEGSVLESAVVSQPESTSRDDENDKVLP